MSGPSGLPRGIPKKPASDSYRPLPPPSSSGQYPRNRSPPYSDQYRFRGNGHPNHDMGRSSLQAESPGHAKYGGDSYRPASNGFTFSMEPPPSIDVSRMSDSYRPGQLKLSEYMPDTQNGHVRTRRDGHRHDGHRTGGRGRGWAYNRGGHTRNAAERPFLLSTRASTPELMPGMEEGEGPGVKYRDLEDLSDSDEADMDFSSDDENGGEDLNSGEPKKKQARTNLNKSADGDSVPRWSNPDPYTVLPPQDESQRKKMDVVKLIRKARVISTSESISKTEAVVDDFISFNFNDEAKEDDGESEETADDEAGNGVPGAPKGPRASSNPALGSRKRNFNDEIKDGPLKPTNSAPSKGTRDGSIVEKWQVVEGINGTPWCTVDHAATENMGYWLHKEIMDFYHHVKPTEFEEYIRSDLVSRLRTSVRRRWKDGDIYPFGSFVAGLYLPTSDMDLVFASDAFLSVHRHIYNKRHFLWKFQDHLISEGFPVEGSIEIIPKAKVPLVKYVDKRTGLRVDVSFENDTGLIANKTFKDWKAQYPAMPILVTLIKQFLAMRALNEPVNGGIGGFTVICLVTSLLQLLPQVQSGNMIPEHHLGEILMEFLDLYGNEFNAVTTAIQLNPPGYISKVQLARNKYSEQGLDKEKISIIDPNNYENDIAGGSKNTPTILREFAKAFKDLQTRIAELHSKPIDQRRGQSILSVILGGNYSSFDIQRDRLRKCYQSLAASLVA